MRSKETIGRKRRSGGALGGRLPSFMALALAVTLLPGLLSFATAGAEAAEAEPGGAAGEIYTSYTVDAGTSSHWGDGYYGYLLDGDPATKWGCEIHETLFIEFHSAEAITPEAYILTTGHDTANYAHRNPKDWCIKAKKNAADDWTTIAAVTGDTTLQAVNSQDCEFGLDVKNAAWQYFRFEVSKTGSGEFQLAELRFRLASQLDPLDLKNASVSGLSSDYVYTGSEIEPACSVTAADGTALTRGSDYTLSISPSPVREPGSYTLTLTGAGRYTGTKTASFTVRAATVDISDLGTQDLVFYWKNGSSAVQWRVISPAGDVKLPDSSAADEILLLSNSGTYAKFDEDGSNAWKGSDAQNQCVALYDAHTDAVERAALRTTTITETGSYAGFDPTSVEGEHFFLLSAREAETYFTDGQDRSAFFLSHWYLRSAYPTYADLIGVVKEGGDWADAGKVSYASPLEWSNIRPACNLDPARVVMVSPSSGDPGTSGQIAAFPENPNRMWRLTLLDDARSGFSVAESALETSAGGTVSVSYSGAQYGAQEYLTVLLFDADGGALGWGRVGPLTAADGTARFTLPETLQPGSYTLKLLNERKGEGYCSNAAGAFRSVALTVNAKPVLKVQAEDLTVTYSGADVPDDAILGTATSAGESIQGKWSFASGQTRKNVSDSGVKQVIFTPDDTATFEPFLTTLTLTIEPKEVTVVPDSLSKHVGEPDPALTATVTGLCGSDTIEYTLTRDAGETPNTFYAIRASGATQQGNYRVSYPTTVGRFRIVGHSPRATRAVPAGCETEGSSAYWTCAVCGKFFSDESCTAEIAENSWVIPALGHKPGTAQRENEEAATCTEGGGYDEVVYCGACSKELSRERKTIPALGHAYGTPDYEWAADNTAVAAQAVCAHDAAHVIEETVSTTYAETTPATENATGIGTWTAAFTNTHFKTQTKQVVIPQLIHVHSLVKTEAIPAGCETEGRSAYWKCSGCYKYFSDAAGTTEIAANSWSIPATGHTPGAEQRRNETAAKCTVDGGYDTVVSCSSCGLVLSRTHITIPATGHTPGDPQRENEIPATCRAEGKYDAVVYCSTCNQELSRERTTIPVLGHSYGTPEYTWAADNTTVTAKTVCANDASHVIEETASTTYTETTPATESTEGVGTYSASFTDTHFSAQTKNVTIPKLTHTHVLVKTDAVAADCENPGNSEYWTCSACGKFFSDAAGTTEITADSWVIPATDHAYGTPTYTWAADNTTVTAKVTCANNASHVIEETASTTYTETTPATESAEGVGTYTANFTDTHFSAQTKNVTIPKLTHTHVLVKTDAVAADCENPGNSEYYTCSVCGKFFSDAAGTTEIAENSWVIPALKHDYGEWVVTTPATETEAGEETRYCANCDAFETRPIPPTGHEETYVERAYRLILGRAGDEDGIAHWNAELAGGASAGGIIRDFFRSEEYLSRGLTDAQTVALCYQAMLSREPDEDEVANWTAMLADGYSTTKLVAEFVASDEFNAICDTYGLSAGTIELSARDQNSNITRFVERCYTLALGRPADEDGLNGWCEHLLTQDLTPERVAFGFIFSDEAKDRALNDEVFITMLYKMMLDREPDADGLANWVSALRQNTAAEIAYDAAFQTGRSEADAIDQTRQNIYATFAQSEEFGLMIANFGF